MDENTLNKIRNLNFSDANIKNVMGLDFSNIKPQQHFINPKMDIPINTHKEEEKIYWEESLRLLKNIEINTANLSTLVDLISSSNDRQDEIISIITELLSVAKETDKEKALSKYRRIMNKINEFSGDADLLIKLSSWGTLMGSILQSNGIL